MNFAFFDTATGEELTKGYGVFKDEALETEADYEPKTVNTDGWKVHNKRGQRCFQRL